MTAVQFADEPLREFCGVESDEIGTAVRHVDVLPHDSWDTSFPSRDRLSSHNRTATSETCEAPLSPRDSQQVTRETVDTISTPIGLSVARVYEQQRTETLLAAIADWRASTGTQRAIDRRYALRLLEAERRRRDASRAELRAAARRTP